MPSALAELQLHSSGKVREIYEFDGDLLMVASDRISAYDVIMPNPIPDKGRVLTQMSLFWFRTPAGSAPTTSYRRRCQTRSLDPAVGSVMVQLGTHLPDPADRLAAIHRSMMDGKDSLSAMTPTQILAMSALGQAPAILGPMLRMQGIVRPPYNLVVSNVPGPRTTHCRSRSTGWRSTSPARPTTARCASASPAAAAPSPTCRCCSSTSTRS